MPDAFLDLEGGHGYVRRAPAAPAPRHAVPRPAAGTPGGVPPLVADLEFLEEQRKRAKAEPGPEPEGQGEIWGNYVTCEYDADPSGRHPAADWPYTVVSNRGPGGEDLAGQRRAGWSKLASVESVRFWCQYLGVPAKDIAFVDRRSGAWTRGDQVHG